MRRLALLALVACSSPPPSRPTIVVVADAGGAETPPPVLPPKPTARWLPSAAFQDIGEHRRAAVVADRRVILEGSEGALPKTRSSEGALPKTRSSEGALPKTRSSEGALRATVVDPKPILGLGIGHRVPDVLGGGWVFVGGGGVWAARTFDGALIPIELGTPNPTIGFGIDCILVNGRMYQLSTGVRAAPPVPNTAELFGLANGEVAVRTGTHEVFYSPAKGKPFTRIAKDIDVLGGDYRTIVLGDGNGWHSVSPNGKVGPTTPPLPGITTTSNLEIFGGRRDLQSVTIAPDIERMLGAQTAAMDDGKVLRVERNDLEVFDGERGVLASTQRDAFAQHQNCAIVRGGTPAFVACNDETRTVLLRIDAFDRPPTIEREFHWSVGPSFGAPASNAALVVAGRCDQGPAQGVLCVRRDATTWIDVEIADPQNVVSSGPLGISVVGSSTGTPYGFDYSRQHGLIVLDGGSRTVRTFAKESLGEWVTTLNWEAATASDGTLRFLLSGDGRSGVMTIDSQGAVNVKALEGSLAARGAKGLLVGPDGHLSETIDAGRTWHDVPPPPGGIDTKPIRCVEAGCTIGAWHRLGW